MRLDDEPIQLINILYDNWIATTNQLTVFRETIYTIRGVFLLFRQTPDFKEKSFEQFFEQSGYSDDRLKGFIDAMYKQTVAELKGKNTQYLEGVRICSILGWDI